MKRIYFLFIYVFFFAQISFAQNIIDSCFTSCAPSTDFISSNDLANGGAFQADVIQWTGSTWIGGWNGAGLTIPPPINSAGCRAIFIGSASSWTTGGEGFGVRLNAPLVAGQTYSFPFTYVSHGTGSNGAFSPNVYTSSTPSLTYLVGSLPAVGATWTTNSISFTATAAQSGHTWIMLTTAPNGSTGLVNSLCKTCNVPSGTVCSVNLGRDTTLCQGNTLVLNATTAGATYQWQDNSVSPTYTVSHAGTYSVTITKGTCTATDVINVSYAVPPSVNLGRDTTLCQGSTLLLNATTSGASYKWQDNSTNPAYTVSQAGTYSVKVTKSGCMGTDAINVSYVPSPTVNLGNDTTLCQGNTLVLDATTSGAVYQWQDNSANPTYMVSSAGTYSVKVTKNNCSTTDLIHVNYASPPVINLGNDTTLCQGSTLLLNATTSGATYKWQDNSTNPVYTVSQAGAYSVKVKIGSCSGTDAINVNYIPAPAIHLGNDTTLCSGNTLMLDATTSGASYKWQDNSTNSAYTVSQAGTYSVTITKNNCTATDVIHVNYYSSNMDLGNDTTLCQGDNLILNATTSGATYQWQDHSTNATYTVSQAGTYSVQVTRNNCTVTGTIHVNYNPLPVVDLGRDTTLARGQTLLLNATTSGATYKWQDRSTNPTYTVSQAGTYSVKVTENGCSTIDAIHVTYIGGNSIIIVPNVITPNGDGVNDSWSIENIQDYPNATIVIYNRWGNIVWQSTGYPVQWNGTNYRNGQLLPDGTYFYIISLMEDQVDKESYTGYIQIIK